MTTKEATRPSVGSTISSEASKLTTAPSHRWLLAIAFLIAPLVAAIFMISLPVTEGISIDEMPGEELLNVALLGVDAAALVTIILAAVFVGTEYSTGLIATTLILTPARGKVLTGKFVAMILTALVTGLVAVALCIALTLGAVAVTGGDPSAAITGSSLRLALGSWAMPVLYTLIAAASTFAFRSTALGILVPLLIIVVGGISTWFGDAVAAIITPLSPTAAIHSLSGVATGHEAIGLVGAVVSLLIWTGLSVGIAAWRLYRRDA